MPLTHSRSPLTISLVQLLMLLVVLLHSAWFYSGSVANLGNLGLGDLGIYQHEFNSMLKYAEVTQNYDPTFYYLMYLFTRYFNYELFVLTCFTIFYLSVIRSFYQLSEVKWLVFVVFCAVFFYPMYQSLSSLVLRQGLGFSLLFLTSFFFYSHRFLPSALKVALAATCHSSMVFYLPVLLVNRLISSLKLLVFCWCIVVVMYVVEIPVLFVDFLPADIAKMARAFSMMQDNYVTGFKPLFLVLSVVPFLFILVRPYYYYVAKDRMMFEIMKIFFVSNSAGLLFSGFPYYDRAMLFSWVLVPLILMNFLSFLYPRQAVAAGAAA